MDLSCRNILDTLMKFLAVCATTSVLIMFVAQMKRDVLGGVAAQSI